MTTRDFLETPQGIVFVSVWVYLRAHMCLSVYRNIWSLINHCHYPRILALYLLHANTSTISPSLALSLFFPWGVFIFGTWCSLTAFTHCLHGIKDERGTHIHTNTQQHTHTHRHCNGTHALVRKRILSVSNIDIYRQSTGPQDMSAALV